MQVRHPEDGAQGLDPDFTTTPAAHRLSQHAPLLQRAAGGRTRRPSRIASQLVDRRTGENLLHAAGSLVRYSRVTFPSFSAPLSVQRDICAERRLRR